MTPFGVELAVFLLCEVIFVCLSLVGEWLLGILPGVISGSAVEELLGAWMCVRPALQHRLVGFSMISHLRES